MGLSPAPMIITFPQAPLRSRTVEFPESGSDLGRTPRSSSREERGLSADSHTPQLHLVYFQGRSVVHRPYSSGYSWNHQAPRAPSRAQGVTSHAVASRTTSAGVTPPSSLPQAHAPILNPPAASVLPLHSRSSPVAVSPGWDEDLPDVSSANLSLRAWTPTPAALVVHSPVSSHQTTAFPTLGPGRRRTTPYSDFSRDSLSRLQSFTNVQARRFARHPDRSYRSA